MGRTRMLARVGAALLLAATAATACSSSDDAAGKAKPDKATRQADADIAAGDWDFELNVDVTNAMGRPVEIGQVAQAGSYGETYVSGGTWKAAGDAKTVVVPAASNDGNTAGHVPIFIQMKDGRKSPTQDRSASQPGDTHEDVLLVLPTVQLRLQLRHTWVHDPDSHCIANAFAGNECFWVRRNTIAVQIRQADGFQWGLDGSLSCLDPTTITGDLGDRTQAWNTFATNQMNSVKVHFRSGQELATDNAKPDVASCWGLKKELKGVRLPGMSFRDTGATAASSTTSDGPNLSGTQLPGAQLPGADFHGLKMKGVSFVGDDPANLAYADFSGADLTDVDFSNADLTGANFEGATIDSSTRFVGALLADVDLSFLDTPLTPEQIYGAGLCRTKLPVPAADAPTTTTTTPLEPPRFEGPNGICSLPFGSIVANRGAGALLMSAGPDPLVLASGGGDLDACPRASTVGPHMVILAPSSGCTTVMASQTAVSGGGDVGVGVSANGGAAGGFAYTRAPNGPYPATACPATTVTGTGKTCPLTVQPKAS